MYIYMCVRAITKRVRHFFLESKLNGVNSRRVDFTSLEYVSKSSIITSIEIAHTLMP